MCLWHCHREFVPGREKVPGDVTIAFESAVQHHSNSVAKLVTIARQLVAKARDTRAVLLLRHPEQRNVAFTHFKQQF